MRDHRLHVISVFGAVLEQIARLAVENLANPAERIEPNAADLARLQQGYVLLGDADPFREFLRAHLALGQHDVEVHDDAHGSSHDAGVVVGDLHRHLENMAERQHEQGKQDVEEIVGNDELGEKTRTERKPRMAG